MRCFNKKVHLNMRNQLNSIARLKALLLGAAVALSPFTLNAADTENEFDQTFKLHGIAFHVTSANEGSLNQLEIAPSGLEIDNSVIKREIDGTVTGADVADANGDGSPEIYIYTTSAGSGSYGQLIAYSANNKKSLTEIYLPPLEDNPDNARGYMGHDEFRLVENSMVRRFPIYQQGDSNAAPTGGMHQLQYKLTAGEAVWVFKLDKSMTY